MNEYHWVKFNRSLELKVNRAVEQIPVHIKILILRKIRFNFNPNRVIQFFHHLFMGTIG